MDRKKECRQQHSFFLMNQSCMESLEMSGIGEIKVRSGANIKYLSVRMAPGRGIWVNVPYGISRKQVEKFLEEKREWIMHTQVKMSVYEEDTRIELKIGSEIKTKFHILKIAGTEESKPSYRMEGAVITLFIPQSVRFERIDKLVRKLLSEIYAEECRQYLPQRVHYYAGKFGFTFKRLSFRDNVSNWGSCSYDNNISLNIKLMKLPDEIIDYVILHELCHTIEKNHSDSFWKLVQKVCPDYKNLRARLRKYHTRI